MSELGRYNPNNSEKNRNQFSRRKLGAAFIAAALGAGAIMGTDKSDVKKDKSGELALDEKIDKMFEEAGIQKGSIINVIAAELVINTEKVNVREGYDVSDFNKITSSELIGVSGAIMIPLTDDDPNGSRYMAILKGPNGERTLISFVVEVDGVSYAATGKPYDGVTTKMIYEGSKDGQPMAIEEGGAEILVATAQELGKNKSK
ncbi:MAG: hypothetical protein NT111_02085 [Patescibacteria group bacterium]|nr:hypothetical protein [Patescibacteria group bacterium]